MAAAAQDVSFNDILNGAGSATVLKIKDLTADYKAVHLHIAGEQSQGMMGGLSGIMMMAMMSSKGSGGGPPLAMMQTMGLADISWTKGQTIHFGGHEFLVTYKMNLGMVMGPSSESDPKMGASLGLNLVRSDLLSSMAPDKMTPDGLRQILSESGAVLDADVPYQSPQSGDDAMMAAILFPVFAQAKLAAQKTNTLSNAKQLALAGLMYSNDWDDLNPYVQSTSQFKTVTMPYLKSEAPWTTGNPNGSRFLFAMNLAGVNSEAVDRPGEAPFIYESKPWPDGRRVVAFLDGHAKMVTPDEWATIEPMLHRKYPISAKKPIKFN